MAEKKKIDKPWAVYKGVIYMPIGIGLITSESTGGTLYIKYGEGQFYPDEPWNPDYVSRFDGLKEAVVYFIERRGGNLEKELERISSNFPKFIRAQRAHLNSKNAKKAKQN